MAIHCPACGWTFRSEKSLRRHMAAHHSEEEQKLASRPPDSSPPGPPPGDGHPGWYPNPDAEETRYWDGTEWVDWNRIDPKDAKRRIGTAQLALSYVGALMLPPAGLIAGIWLLVRRSGHGIAVVLIAILVGVGGLFLPGGPFTSDSDDPSAIHIKTPHVGKCFHLTVQRQNACLRHAVSLK